MPTLMPSPRQRFYTNGAVPAAGCKLYTYAAGTSTPKDTYTDAAGLVPHENPITLDAKGECLAYFDGAYKLDLKTAAGVQITGFPVDDFEAPLMPESLSAATGSTLIRGTWYGGVVAYLSAFATSIGASLIGWIQAGTNTTIRSIQDKLREIPSLNDFDGDDASERFISAKANGTKWLRIPSGVHTITGWTVAESDSLANLVFDPGAQLLVTATTNAIGLDIQKATFNISGTLDMISSGSKADGLNTIGLRCGNPVIVGKAYIRIEATRTSGFSKRGVVFYQPVYVGIERAVSIGDMYGISVEPALGIGGSTVCIGPSYITGAKRGINLEMASWVTLHEPITEYCGDAVSTDGALHFKSCGSVTVIDRYGEQNARNMVKDDSSITFINGSMFTATSPDIVSYTGTAEADRGTSQFNSKILKIRRISYDDIDTQNLQIGPSTSAAGGITVPTTGGSVIWGSETRQTLSGTLVNATWTTVKAFTSDEMDGINSLKAFFEIVAYAGDADLSAGQFFAGTVINGVLYSTTGVIPAWIRIDGDNVQMNVTSTTYGLNYKIAMRRVCLG